MLRLHHLIENDVKKKTRSFSRVNENDTGYIIPLILRRLRAKSGYQFNVTGQFSCDGSAHVTYFN